MGLSACNSSGHLSNHADIAPNHAGITFAISNTLVSHTSERYTQEIISNRGETGYPRARDWMGPAVFLGLIMDVGNPKFVVFPK